MEGTYHFATNEERPCEMWQGGNKEWKGLGRERKGGIWMKKKKEKRKKKTRSLFFGGISGGTLIAEGREIFEHNLFLIQLCPQLTF